MKAIYKISSPSLTYYVFCLKTQLQIEVFDCDEPLLYVSILEGIRMLSKYLDCCSFVLL
jgi:hypothetical protein